MRKQTSKNKTASISQHLEYIYFFIAPISLALIIWQYYGMNRVLDVYPHPDSQIVARGDAINGGRSETSLIANSKGTQLHCETKASNAFPFCNLELNIAKNKGKGIDLNQFDYISLELEHHSSARDTVLIYLVNAEQKKHNTMTKSAHFNQNYNYKSNMKTILPTNNNAEYKLALQNFFVPSWWILQNEATGDAAEPKLDNVIRLSIATGDSNQLRSVDIILKRVQFTGKWISAQTLYLLIILVWITMFTLHGLYRVIKLAEKLELNRTKNKKLEEINAFLSIQKDEFETLAKTDPLTGLYNRAGTRELLQQVQSDLAGTYALIMFDIDHFKQINDTYGHEIGDQILYALAQHIRSHMRESDHIARWGGEEFIILCPQKTKENAFHIANMLRETISKACFPMEQKISCSFGVAQFIGNRENSIQSMFEVADAAMYSAKKSGRNRVELGQIE